MRHFKNIFMAVAVLAGSVAASASTTFDFRTSASTGTRNVDDSLTFMAGALSVDVFGFRATDGTGVSTPLSGSLSNDQVFQGGNGLVFDFEGSAAGAGGGDNHRVDGRGSNEFLIFSFNRSVSLDAINFDFAGGFFQVLGGVSFGANSLDGSSIFSGPVGGGFQITNFNPVLGPGTVFAVGATGRNDEFKLRTLTVTGAVPEPATWLMMILGFGIVGLARKRRVNKQFA